MNPVRIGAAVVVSALAAGLLASASALMLPWHDSGEATLRLSLRARPERIEHCRAPSEQELAQLPEHMRQRLICEGTTASYLLRVDLDGLPVDSQVVRGGGLRNDRPLQLLREYGVTPGRRRITVTVARRETPEASGEVADSTGRDPDGGTFGTRADREGIERERGRRAAIPAALALDTIIDVASGRVVLVTFDPDARELRLPARPR